LQSLLGRGGNAEVWKGLDGDGRLGAVKVLRRDRLHRERLTRFKSEISFLLKEGLHRGVLPLIDAHIPTDDEKGDFPWLVMVVAEPIRGALGPEPSVVEASEAIHEIAGTLADLAESGIGHRDIKPQNLYALDGRFLVGDFGLVTYPDKDPVTRTGRRLGPIDFMAPEMREYADTAEPEPADVYALAKTFWVLAMGRELPLPGPHRIDDAAYSLRHNLVGDRLIALDLLIESATVVEPGDRVSLREFQAELGAWLAPPPRRDDDSPDPALTKRLSQAIQPARRAQENQQEANRRANAVFERLREGPLARVHSRISEIEGLNTSLGTRGGLPEGVRDLRETSGRRVMHKNEIASLAHVPGLRGLGIGCVVGVRLYDDQQLRIGAACFEMRGAQAAEFWREEREVRLDSARQEAAIDEMEHLILRQIDPALQRLTEAVEAASE
jgi:serine/threonine protein kinase